MKTRLIIFILIVFISCGKKTENVRFYSLNPSFEEYYLDSTLKNEQKINRIELLGIEGYYGRNQKYYVSVDSLVRILGNKYKHKHPIYSIEFYELGKNILKDKRYSYKDLRYGEGKQFTLAWVVFENGKLKYFHFVEDGKEVYNYISKQEMNEIYE
jgi:hypothetical protein